MPLGLKRYQQEDHYHAINFSCYDRRHYLNDDHSRIVFEETLEQIRKRHQLYIFAYVLMPEHVHLLVSEPKRYSLATSISVLKGETSKRLKGDRPQFWQDRYYDFNIITYKKYVEKLKYIHRNPVTRVLVENPEDWPWSSFRHYLTGEPGRVEIESEWAWNRCHPRPHSSRLCLTRWVGIREANRLLPGIILTSPASLNTKHPS